MGVVRNEEITEQPLKNRKIANCVRNGKIVWKNDQYTDNTILNDLDIWFSGIKSNYILNPYGNNPVLMQWFSNIVNPHLSGSGFNIKKTHMGMQLEGISTNDIFSIPRSQSILRNPFTLSTTAKYDVFEDNRGLMGDNGNVTTAGVLVLGQCNGTKLKYGFDPGGTTQDITRTTILTNGLNEHNEVVMTYDGNTLKLYSNGNLITSWTANLSFSTIQSIRLGRTLNAIDRMFKGEIRDFKLYLRDLTLQEIQQNYQQSIDDKLVQQTK